MGTGVPGQGTERRVCPLFPSPQHSPVVLLGRFSLETRLDAVLLCGREHLPSAFSDRGHPLWGGFIHSTREICDFALSFGYIDH